MTIYNPTAIISSFTKGLNPQDRATLEEGVNLEKTNPQKYAALTKDAKAKYPEYNKLTDKYFTNSSESNQNTTQTSINEPKKIIFYV